MRVSFLFIWLSALFLLVSCGKDDPSPDGDKALIAPSDLQVTVDQANNRAVVTGKADPNITIQLNYKGSLGGIAAVGKTDAQGIFTLTVGLLNGYVQKLVAFTQTTSGVEKKSPETTVPDIPVRNKGIDMTVDEIKQLLQSVRWKSDQNLSRLIQKQSNPTPPYDMFVLVAQKYFEFKENGAFYFAVTSPMQFADDKGKWTISDQKVLNIQTTIPLGPMELTNIRIQEITENKLTLLADISDGVFLISLNKE